MFSSFSRVLVMNCISTTPGEKGSKQGFQPIIRALDGAFFLFCSSLYTDAHLIMGRVLPTPELLWQVTQLTPSSMVCHLITATTQLKWIVSE